MINTGLATSGLTAGNWIEVGTKLEVPRNPIVEVNTKLSLEQQATGST